jgi:hypothetical protein
MDRLGKISFSKTPIFFPKIKVGCASSYKAKKKNN